MPYIEARTAWVAEKAGAIIGFAVLDVAAKNVWALFVDPTAERAGTGRALHYALVDRARQLRLTELTLSTEDGTRAARFYSNAGWQRAGCTHEGELIFRLRVATAPDD